jgi:hypothetical protein
MLLILMHNQGPVYLSFQICLLTREGSSILTDLIFTCCWAGVPYYIHHSDFNFILQHHSWQRSVGNVINLKVVTSGSEEFRIAKELKGLFMEFSVHQERLHKSLAKEERLILQATKVAL